MRHIYLCHIQHDRIQIIFLLFYFSKQLPSAVSGLSAWPWLPLTSSCLRLAFHTCILFGELSVRRTRAGRRYRPSARRRENIWRQGTTRLALASRSRQQPEATDFYAVNSAGVTSIADGRNSRARGPKETTTWVALTLTSSLWPIFLTYT